MDFHIFAFLLNPNYELNNWWTMQNGPGIRLGGAGPVPGRPGPGLLWSIFDFLWRFPIEVCDLGYVKIDHNGNPQFVDA